jgi:sensor histidine kinase YesM
MAITSKAYHKFFSTKDIIIRHLIIAVISLAVGYLSFLSAPQNVSHFFLRAYISNFIYIALIWNGNILLMGIVDRVYDIDTEVRKKLLLAAAVALCLPIFMHYTYSFWFFPMVNGFDCSLNSKENYIYLIVSVVTTLLVNSVYMSIEFFNHWRKTLVEKEEFKRTSLSAEFEALKNQVNPHFLFNSLNTLSSLIDENPTQANEFVQKLSSVYRYVLTHRDKETVLLQDEVEFIKSYIFLNKIRFGENLNIHINLTSACLALNIPTLTLQMLVENAIKHNIISANKPLTVHINCDDEYIVVTNNLQAKLMTVESSGIGLSNIVERYKYLTKKPVFIQKTDIDFSVKVPLV